ncbi:MAG: hypothetical protein JJE46_07665 [Acidimicrobiia bacterium]|nr:hypothetical protein [Acidimicrobiia bacterium]
MTYAFIQDVPIDAVAYERIRTELGDERPEGMVTHLAIERPEGGLRYIDVWESEADWQRFVEERLHPVVHRMLAEVFGENLPEEPALEAISVLHVW